MKTVIRPRDLVWLDVEYIKSAAMLNGLYSTAQLARFAHIGFPMAEKCLTGVVGCVPYSTAERLRKAFVCGWEEILYIDGAGTCTFVISGKNVAHVPYEAIRRDGLDVGKKPNLVRVDFAWHWKGDDGKLYRVDGSDAA